VCRPITERTRAVLTHARLLASAARGDNRSGAGHQDTLSAAVDRETHRQEPRRRASEECPRANADTKSEIPHPALQARPKIVPPSRAASSAQFRRLAAAPSRLECLKRGPDSPGPSSAIPKATTSARPRPTPRARSSHPEYRCSASNSCCTYRRPQKAHYAPGRSRLAVPWTLPRSYVTDALAEIRRSASRRRAEFGRSTHCRRSRG